jgi:hypothetical protein
VSAANPSMVMALGFAALTTSLQID